MATRRRRLRLCCSLALALLMPLVAGSPIAAAWPAAVAPTPAPLFALDRRNHAGPPQNFTSLTQPIALADSTSPASSSPSATVDPSLTSSAFNATSTSPTDSLFNGIPTSLLQWVAVVIIGAILLSLILARYLFIRRFYRPTLRAYFIPVKGIHINRLGIHIRGPPARPTPSARDYALERRSRRSRHTTTGPDILSDGRRAHYGVDGDEELPGYHLDTELPTYDSTWGRQAAPPDAQGPSTGEPHTPEAGVHVASASPLVSRPSWAGVEEGDDVVAYEAATRVGAITRPAVARTAPAGEIVRRSESVPATDAAHEARGEVASDAASTSTASTSAIAKDNLPMGVKATATHHDPHDHPLKDDKEENDDDTTLSRRGSQGDEGHR